MRNTYATYPSVEDILGKLSAILHILLITPVIERKSNAEGWACV